MLADEDRPEFKNTFSPLYKKLKSSFTDYYFAIISMAIMLSPAYCNTYNYEKFIECVSCLKYMKSSFIPLATTRKIYEICCTTNNTYKNEALFYNRIYCAERVFKNETEVFLFCLDVCDEIINSNYNFTKDSLEEIQNIKETFEQEIKMELKETDI